VSRTVAGTGIRAAALGLALVGIASCGAPPPPVGAVYVERRPPPTRVEVIGPRPAVGYVWIGGYWRWGPGDYVWVPGRWTIVEPGHRKWVKGRWAHRGRVWYWIDGHWR
jgi:hypothetical protein